MDPVVKLTPDFKVGETVIHLAEGTEHKILKLDKDGNLQLTGVATLIRPDAVKKK